MRGRVLAGVRGRLRAAGVSLDAADLEACYSQAWHGLYATMLEGAAEVANPEGWLALVTYRRAIDEHRSHGAHVTPMGDAGEPSSSTTSPAAHMSSLRGPRARGTRTRASGTFGDTYERDLAGELDDRARLRQLMEGLRGRLGPRERQAAALCYLQGLSRADAAARMGISQTRMRKLMEGSGAGSPGVAGKVGELLNTIRAGSYCAEQSSLMRGFAFGILDPGGERYALAVAHQRECPACRAHVLSLRGLASVLPPLPLPFLLGAGAGGGWLMAGGGITAKLAVGCLVAVSVGAGCVALSAGPIASLHARTHRRHLARTPPSRVPVADEALLSSAQLGAQLSSAGAASSTRAGASRRTASSGAGGSQALTPAAKAGREFGPEQTSHRVVSAARPSISQAAHVASAAGGGSGESSSTTGGESPGSTTSSSGSSAGGGGSSGHESGGPSAAAREFGLG